MDDICQVVRKDWNYTEVNWKVLSEWSHLKEFFITDNDCQEKIKDVSKVTENNGWAGEKSRKYLAWKSTHKKVLLDFMEEIKE